MTGTAAASDRPGPALPFSSRRDAARRRGMAYDVLGRAGPGLMPGPTTVVAPVRGRVTRGQVALALVELSSVGSSTSTHLPASLRSLDRA